MNVARLLYPVEVLGPGRRVGIWLCGCPHGCPGCSNPELWRFRPEYETTAQSVFEMVSRVAEEHPVDGFTITGGDPMLQGEALLELTGLLQTISRDILVYTGYEREALDPRLLQNIAVLIDGKYVAEKNDGAVLRGSSNQRIRILDEAFRGRYEAYLETATNEIQNFTTRDGIVSVGIHKPGFRF